MRNTFIKENPEVKFGFEMPSNNSSPMRSMMMSGSPMGDNGPNSSS